MTRIRTKPVAPAKTRLRDAWVVALAILAILALAAFVTVSAIRAGSGDLNGVRSAGTGNLWLIITRQSDGSRLLAARVRAGDTLEFEWIHSVEHFPWFERFDIEPDGSLFLRETRIAGFGAGVPFERGTSVRIENGYIVYSGIDEAYPSYRWINSETAVAAIFHNGTVLAHGSDLPHHEALELRVQARR